MLGRALHRLATTRKSISVEKKIFIVGWMALFSIASLIRLNWLRAAQFEPFSFCLFKNLTGFPCPGCGMGHALIAAAQGSWQQSWNYHPLGIPFLAVWTIAVVSALVPSAGVSHRLRTNTQLIRCATLVLVGGVYLLRHAI